VRVVESRAEGERLRLLQVNESFDSFQSVWQPEPGLLEGSYYYNLFAAPPWWSEPRRDWKLLVLGLGAGTAWRVLEGALPRGSWLQAEGVEIDPVVVELAREHLELPAQQPGRWVYAGWDARAALRLLPNGAYDEIVLDTYANQTEIPAHLASHEFFREVRAHLRPGGWLAVNVGGFGLDDPVVSTVAATLARAFAPDPVLVVRVPFARNALVFARRDAAPLTPREPGWRVGHEELGSILARCSMDGMWELVRDDAHALVLADDDTRIDHLQRLSIARAAALEPSLGATP
jgi:spermidine synthase